MPMGFEKVTLQPKSRKVLQHGAPDKLVAPAFLTTGPVPDNGRTET
jgi:hypothetical protein